MSAATLEAGRKLQAEGRVRPIEDAQAFLVHSTSNAYYVVVLVDDLGTCTCPARFPCKHIEAAKRQRDQA